MPLSIVKFYSFVEKLAEGGFNLETDALKLMLSNTAPALGNSVKSDITEIAAGNGYPSGGIALTVTSSAQVSGSYKLVLADVTDTATGAVGPFRYGVLYDSTTNNLIGYLDYGSALTLASGDALFVDLDQVGGVLTLS